MQRKRILYYAAAAFAVVLLATAGGVAFFHNSADWREIKSLISSTPTVTSRVGTSPDVSLSPFGISYRFSGDWAKANLKVKVNGDKGSAQFAVEAEKIEGVWRLKSIRET